ncbi:autotransporter outer membrane beta-barrel domain-containing protein [Tichowtungia aerotolerans]|uniref:Uncharacterized protein n=1 Tax=Tichowtungia aerotolerans TaxID=2697043 RepID=A0A6P1MAY2_9BACT|nr:hypothetical protein [Tichowtungia aerotolerans]QHI68275.1 hypothetical protein GT409_01995 [Tichowtungia aerotolerans]
MKIQDYIFVLILSLTWASHAETVVWDDGASDGSRWGTAANWNPDTTPNSSDDFDFAGNSISALGGDMTAKTLIGGDSSTLRMRSAGVGLYGDLRLVGSNVFWRYVETGEKTVSFAVNGSATVGGDDFRFMIDHADDTVTFDIQTLILQASSKVRKQGSGNLILNAASCSANGNTIEVDSGQLMLDGAADYSGLTIDVTGATSSGKFVVGTNSITLAGLIIEGTEIDPGVYAPGDDIFTTYSARLVNDGGTLNVGAVPSSTVTWDEGAADSSRWGTAANWNPDTLPNSVDDFDFTGNSISALGGDMIAKTLIAGDASTLRMRSPGVSLLGDLQLVGSNVLWRYVETGEMTVSFSVDGSAMVGGDDFRFMIDHADDTVTFNMQSLILPASSKIQKQGSGNLTLNATSCTVNGNTIEVDSGKLTLDGTADYSDLTIDVTGATSSGKFVVGSNSVTLAGLTIEGNFIDSGVYAPGDDIFTTYSARLLNEGGTLIIGATEGYDLWVENAGLTAGVNDGLTDNPDGDALNNLYEYGLGGNPIDETDMGQQATFVNDDGTMTFVHVQRSDDSSLSYYLETCDDLVSGAWTNNGYLVTGTNVTGNTFDYVTNMVLTVDGQKFIRLVIEK